MDYIKALWIVYLKNQKNKILDFAKNEYNNKQITKDTLEDVYFKHFILWK